MPTITVPLAFTPHNTAISPSDLTNLHQIMHPHPENLASGLVLIALLTYFYTAFSKIFQPGGDHHHQQQQQQNGKQAFLKLESRIYYSSAAASLSIYAETNILKLEISAAT
ncbi:hypothetical protein MBLNU13_g01836t1 [Cladosporium sp. NU13]